MKGLTSKLIVAVCVLVLGFMAFVPFNPQVEATPDIFLERRATEYPRGTKLVR